MEESDAETGALATNIRPSGAEGETEGQVDAGRRAPQNPQRGARGGPGGGVLADRVRGGARLIVGGDVQIGVAS